MTLKGLRDLYRATVRDQASPPLWINLLVDEFANDAQMEAVRRGWSIIDSTTAEFCQYAYTTDPVIILAAEVITIREAIISGQSIPLERIGLDLMDRLSPGWRATTAVRPTSYIHDYQSGAIRLFPTPTTAGTLLLTVAREPVLMVTDDDAPEIPARHHRSLLQWMLYRGFSMDDTETVDPRRAAMAKAEFEAEFGPRRSARNEKWAAEQAGTLPDTLC